MDFNNVLKVFVRAMLNTDKKIYTSLKMLHRGPRVHWYYNHLQTNNDY